MNSTDRTREFAQTATSAVYVSQQKIYNSKNDEETETTTAPFPTCIACYQSSEPLIHFLFFLIPKKNCANHFYSIGWAERNTVSSVFSLASASIKIFQTPFSFLSSTWNFP